MDPKKVGLNAAGRPSLLHHHDDAQVGDLPQSEDPAQAAHTLRQKPAQAADLITQCVKALEKSTVDAHWGSAQFLELPNPEGAGLLERDGEFFTSREFLNDFKLKGYNQ